MHTASNIDIQGMGAVVISCAQAFVLPTLARTPDSQEISLAVETGHLSLLSVFILFGPCHLLEPMAVVWRHLTLPSSPRAPPQLPRFQHPESSILRPCSFLREIPVLSWCAERERLSSGNKLREGVCLSCH